MTKTVFITGAATGIGRATALLFAGRGYYVGGYDIDETGLQVLAADIAAVGGSGVVGHLDVTDAAEVSQRLSEFVAGAGGRLDVMINNAGLLNAGHFEEIPVAVHHREIDVNIKGVVNVIRHFVPAMVQQRSGVIVNFSSGWGRSASPEVAPYCATKWAIEGLSQALAAELPAGMAAVALNPGVINTEMLRSCWGESAGDYQDAVEWARRAVPFILQIGPQDNGKPLTIPSRR